MRQAAVYLANSFTTTTPAALKAALDIDFKTTLVACSPTSAAATLAVYVAASAPFDK